MAILELQIEKMTVTYTTPEVARPRMESQRKQCPKHVVSKNKKKQSIDNLKIKRQKHKYEVN